MNSENDPSEFRFLHKKDHIYLQIIKVGKNEVDWWTEDFQKATVFESIQAVHLAAKKFRFNSCDYTICVS